MPSSSYVRRSGLVATLLVLSSHMALGQSAAPVPNPQASRLLAAARARQPVGFEANVGQAAPGNLYVARTEGYDVMLGKDATLVQQVHGSRARSTMALLGAHPAQRVPEQPLAAGTSYVGAGGAAPHDAPAYARITYRQVYRGIDAIYHSRDGAVEYDFEVAPGADPRAIRLSFSDARTVEVDAGSGELVVADRSGTISRHSPPDIYQQEGPGRHPIAGRYRMLAPRVVGFDVESYDRAQPLIIDPTINVTTFIYGNGFDSAYALAVDTAGYTYITGLTNSTIGFPAGTSDKVDLGARDCALAQQAHPRVSCGSAFVVKLNPAGSIVASVLFGGTVYTIPNAIAVDDSYVYVAGGTTSPTITTAQGQRALVTYAYGKAPSGVMRAFLAKFSVPLTTFAQVTTLASSGLTEARGLAVDHGAPYVVGMACGDGFPTTVIGYRNYRAGMCDAFVTKLDYLGTLSGQFAPVYSTYLGGSSADIASAVAVNSVGAAWVTGSTCSADFTPQTSLNLGSAGTRNSAGELGCNAFLTEMDPTGATYQRSMYFGGNNAAVPADYVQDGGLTLALDGDNAAWIGGWTESDSFLTIEASDGHNPLQGSRPCTSYHCMNGFVSYVTNFALVYSTYVGGANWSSVASLATDSRRNLYVGGFIYTDTKGLPGAPPLALAGTGGYVMRLSGTLDTLGWTQLLGIGVTGVVARPAGVNTALWTSGDRITSATSLDAFMVQMTDPYTVAAPPGCGRLCVVR